MAVSIGGEAEGFRRVDETRGRQAPCTFAACWRSEGRIVRVGRYHRLVVRERSELIAVFLAQGDRIMRPDALAQIVKEFDDGQGLFGRPSGVDEEFDSAAPPGSAVSGF